LDADVDDGPKIAPVQPDPQDGSPGAARTQGDLRPLVAALIAFGVAYYFALTRLVRGDLLNSYPFISADGFDWLTGGLAVARWFDGLAIPELQWARNPGFIAVVFGDFHLGADGAWLFAVISAAVVVSVGAPLLLARWLDVPRYQAATLVLVLAVSPLGFFRMWILADQIASALLVVTAVALYPYLTNGSRKWLLAATVAAAIGGATQLYGLMAFLVVAGWCFAVSVWRREPDLMLALALVLAPVTSFAFLELWRGQVPHAGVAPQFNLIQLNFNMLDFYIDTWSWVFAPLLPLLAALIVYRRHEVRSSPFLTGYWLAVLALMVSTFLYQFEDSRFTIPTSLMLGVAVMATLPGERPLPRPRTLMAIAGVGAVLMGFFLVPASYWKPEWSNMSLDPSRSHVARLISAEPRDRLGLADKCGSSRFCIGVALPANLSEYERTSIGLYRYLITADPSQPVEDYAVAIFEGLVHQRNTNDCCLADTSLSYGSAGSVVIAGHWDGSPPGTDTPGTFKTGLWLLRNSNTDGPADVEIMFGQAGDVPVAGDWNGDGIDTIGVFRDGLWLLRNSNSEGGADLEFLFGETGDVPVVGDWTGDGIDTVGLYRDGRWWLRNSNEPGRAEVEFRFGDETHRPVAGDWDGDGVDSVGIFSKGAWRLRDGLSADSSDFEFYFGTFGDRPLTGDWDGDGVDTIGISR
jgi:hypothetical protein